MQSRIPSLTRGHVRPFIPRTSLAPAKQIDMALRVLLYSSEAVLDSDVIKPSLFSPPSRLRDELDFMHQIRPLVERGILRFYWRNPDHESHQAFRSGVVYESIRDGLYFSDAEEEWRRLPGLRKLPWPRLMGEISRVAWDIAPSHMLSEENRSTPIILRPHEALAWRSLSGDEFQAGKPSNVHRLAAMTVPNLRGSVKDLVDLRLSDDGFFQVREAIHSAIGMQYQSDQFDEDAVVDEMQLAAQRLERSMRSPFLEGITIGKKELAFAALSAVVTSVVDGEPVSGAWGAGAAVLGMAAWEAAEKRKSSAQTRSVQKMLMAFGEAGLV